MNKGTEPSTVTYLQVATPKSPNTDTLFEDTKNNINKKIQTDIETPETKMNVHDKRAKQNVLDEIDIEILLKHREYSLILNEIEKVKSNMSILKNLHDDPNYATFINHLLLLQEHEVPHQSGSQQLFDHKSSFSSYGSAPSSSYNSHPSGEFGPYSLRRYSNKTQEIEQPRSHRTSYGGIHPIVDANGNKVCVHKRSDGVIVKVECSACGRTDFGSAQGFLNHSRLSHQIEYKSQDHAALQCGQVLTELEQDELGTSSLEKLRAAGLDVNKNLAPGFALVEIEGTNKKKRKMSKSGKTPPSLNKNNNTNSANNQSDISLSSSQSPLPQSAPGKTLPPSSHLAKMYSKSNIALGDSNDFQSLLKEVSAEVVMEDLEDFEQSLSPGDDSTNLSSSAGAIQPAKPSLVKGHSRRKSRGGLSSVKFEDDSLKDRNFTLATANTTTNHYRTSSTGSMVDPIDDSVFIHHNNPDPHHHLTATINPSNMLQRQNQDDANDDYDMDIATSGDSSHEMVHLMTPAQKRRIPSVPNPLRTRSRATK